MWIESEWSFKASADAKFDCEFLGKLIDELAVITPEFAAGELELGELVTAICTEAMEHLGK